jgi:hypothetical protein
MTISVFNTYSDLVAATPSAGDTALLLGYNAKGDGGGGEFYWDSASTATPHGSIIVQPGGGGTGRWFRVLGQDGPINVKWFGAAGDGSTPDQTAIDAAIAYCVANNRTLEFPDGTYMHSGAINWAFNNFHVMAAGENVVFVHTGTGFAHNFSGIANYPGTQGCVAGVFGGPGRIMLKGNPAGGTTRVINLDNWHQGYMKVALHDGQTAFYGNDTGVVNSSAVETTFDMRITPQDGPWAQRPGHGIDFIKPVACIFEKLIVENVGTGGVAAVALTGASNNFFRGGTIESNLGSGITEDSTCNHNTYIQLANEANGGTNDWILSGTATVLINCNGGGVNGCLFNSTGATLIGGGFYNVVINDNNLWSNSTEFHGTFTNNGTHTTIINPLGGVATAVESAATILQFKTFDTAAANTFKLNGNTVNAVTGTGSTVALQASPRFTGQVEIGANVAPDATLTVNNNSGATAAPDSSSELHLIAPDAANGGIFLDSFSNEMSIVSRFSAGTRAARLAAGPDTNYFGIYGEAWNGGAYVYGAAFEFRTLNAQTGSDGSHKARLRLVPSGSTTLTDVMLWGPGVAIGNGAAIPSAGNLNLGGGDLQNNGVSPTGAGAYVRAISPALTGSPTATTASVNDNSTKIATTAYVDAAWTSYTPSSIVSETVGGTPATYTLNSARYKQIGKTITVAFDVSVTNQGVGNSGAILISLPFTGAAFHYVGSLVEYNTTGDGGTVFLALSATKMYCAKATYATTLIVTGYRIAGEVTYEIP